MIRIAREIVLVLLVLGLAFGAPSAALANGDPASDVLGTRDVFVPGEFNSAPPTGLLPSNRVAQVRALVAQSRAHGYRIKVALISAPSDLGLVYQLWRQPGRYASFLGKELRAFWNYRGRLLVVMPDGYGIYHSGRSVTREEKILDSLPPPSGPLDVARASEEPVLRLAAERGVKLTLPPLPASAESEGSTGHRNLVWLGVCALLLIAAAAGAVILRRRRRRVSGATSSP
jgi:LPXTG-motif cell wall-anchored protein